MRINYNCFWKYAREEGKTQKKAIEMLLGERVAANALQMKKEQREMCERECSLRKLPRNAAARM